MRHPQTAQRQMARVLDRCWDVAVRAWGPGGIKKVGREWLGIIFILENDFNLRTPGPLGLEFLNLDERMKCNECEQSQNHGVIS